MHQWRYHAITLRDLSIAESKLNAEGEKGWELVAICMIDSTTARAFFKQPSDGTAPSAEAPAPAQEPAIADSLSAAPVFGEPLALSALNA